MLRLTTFLSSWSNRTRNFCPMLMDIDWEKGLVRVEPSEPPRIGPGAGFEGRQQRTVLCMKYIKK